MQRHARFHPGTSWPIPISLSPPVPCRPAASPYRNPSFLEKNSGASVASSKCVHCFPSSLLPSKGQVIPTPRTQHPGRWGSSCSRFCCPAVLAQVSFASPLQVSRPLNIRVLDSFPPQVSLVHSSRLNQAPFPCFERLCKSCPVGSVVMMDYVSP